MHSISAASTDPSDLELKSKTDKSNIQETSGIGSESNTLGYETSVAETENKKPLDDNSPGA